jgi:hypothetical protein
MSNWSSKAASALCVLINRGSFHGQDFCARVGDLHRCTRVLLACEKEKWIERGKFQLTSIQEAIGGAHHLPQDNHEWMHNRGHPVHPPLGFHWITKTTVYLKAEVVKTVIYLL